ncbi:MAG: zinc ribbon domain-containing protein [Clostridiales bacterium]|nr:zinc ribbon domain-containing protein [Clostridiales bacterium]
MKGVVTMSVYCNNCSAAIDEGVNYCPQCGASVNGYSNTANHTKGDQIWVHYAK